MPEKRTLRGAWHDLVLGVTAGNYHFKGITVTFLARLIWREYYAEGKFTLVTTANATGRG